MGVLGFCGGEDSNKHMSIICLLLLLRSWGWKLLSFLVGPEKGGYPVATTDHMLE